MSNQSSSKISKQKSKSRRRSARRVTFNDQNSYLSVQNNKSFEVTRRKRAHDEQDDFDSLRKRLCHNDRVFVPTSRNASASKVYEERPSKFVIKSGKSKNPATEAFLRPFNHYSRICDYQNNEQSPKKLKLLSAQSPSKTGESISRNLNNQNFSHTIATPIPMSYTCLKNLCDDQIAPEETSSRLSEHAQLQRFEALLQQQNEIRYDLMKLVVSVINKVGQSRIPAHVHTILGVMNKTRFWYNLGIFIAELETKKECLKDPDLSLLLEHLCKIFSVSLERLPHLHSRIPFHQLQSAVNFFKENGNVPKDPAVDKLLADVITKCERVKKGIREKGQSQVEPPDDFRTLSVFPTAEDIFKNGKPFLRENIVKRPFSSVDHYLDIHFRLLKEDSLAGLRNGIWDLRKSYRQQQYGKAAQDSLSKSSTARAKNDVVVYNEVMIKEPVSTNRRNVTKGIVYNVTFNANHPSIKRVNWARSKRLLFESLVCLISKDFEKVHFATVANRSADMLEQGYIQLSFEGNKCPDIDDMQEEYRMVESSSAYFVAYRHILERLQQVKDETMPFKEYIVFCEHEISKPSYFKADKKETINLQTLAVKQLQLADEDREMLKNVSPYDLSTWPDGDAIGLNDSQYRAFQSALRREFAVIQGPPGTGKTYLGLKIAHALLDNNHLWADEDDGRSCPILMLAYTNHALDSFLEGLTINRKDIIRIGGRSSSDVLKECNINVVRRERQSTEHQGRVRLTRGRRFHEVRRERENCQQSLNRYTDILTKSFKGILPAREFMDCMLMEHLECLSDNNTMLDFLGISINPKVEQNAMELANEEEGFEEFFGHEREGHFYVGYSSQFVEDETRETKDKILICSVEETSNPQGLLNRLKTDAVEHERTNALEVRTLGFEILQLNPQEKWSLYLLWLTRLREKLHIKIREKQSEYLDLNNEFEELRNIEDLVILRNSRVVGMTTTCAAKNHKLLRQLKPRVVIIEEAAELFEAHIVTCLTEYCQHLILIGDHQQLRPNPSVYKLSVNYSLDVSLLERMIEAGVPYNRLSVQHRMRPEICKLIRYIYHGLEDHTSVTEYENIQGVSRNLFFIDHDVRESVHDTAHSKVNQHEAEFLVELCLYLLRQGYRSSQITILTTYKGQMFVIRDLIKSKKAEFEDDLPRVSSVDNFQGEENDVILLSLVRNNEEENIGFLKTKNRVCVALSRARKGLYIIGSRTMLTNQSPLWKDVLADLEKNGCVGKLLPLECSKHKTQNLVSSASDFKEFVPNGGCLEKCQERLQCGHACPQMCHPKSHENFKCEKPCPRNASGCNVSGHKCQKLCHEKCDNLCQYPVAKLLKCGHTLTLACSIDAETAKCEERCEKIISCGHRCQAKCSAPCTTQCMELVKKLDLSCGHQNTMACSATQKDCKVPCNTLLECGHRCVGKCGECIQGRVHVKCKKKCTRNLVCSHQCKSNCSKNCPPCKKKCPRKCYHNNCDHICAEICIPCKEPCSWKCDHYQCTQLCSDMCDRPRCNRPCHRKLTCGTEKPHFCRSLCEERCVCVICHKNNGEDLRTILFGYEDNEDARFIRLKDCEHIFEYTALDKMMDSHDESGEIKPKVCPLCRAPIIKSQRYGNVVKRIHNDIDQVKKKVFGNTTELEEKKTLVRRLASELSPEMAMELESMKSSESAWKKVDEYLKNGQSVCYQDVLLLESEMRLLKSWLLIRRAYEEAIKSQKQSRSSTSHIEFDSEMQNVLSRILVIPAYTCARILDQLNLEVQRMSLKRDVLVLKMKCASSKSNLDEVDEEIATTVQNILQHKEVIEEDSLEKFKKGILDIYSRNPQLAPVTEEEKIQIVHAIGLKQGHWFKCPNGHFYAIGECGGAMEKSKCPECGAVIGGQQHQLASGNELASEMDGAKYAAWSDQANIQNYQIDD